MCSISRVLSREWPDKLHEFSSRTSRVRPRDPSVCRATSLSHCPTGSARRAPPGPSRAARVDRHNASFSANDFGNSLTVKNAHTGRDRQRQGDRYDRRARNQRNLVNPKVGLIQCGRGHAVAPPRSGWPAWLEACVAAFAGRSMGENLAQASAIIAASVSASGTARSKGWGRPSRKGRTCGQSSEWPRR